MKDLPRFMRIVCSLILFSLVHDGKVTRADVKDVVDRGIDFLFDAGSAAATAFGETLRHFHGGTSASEPMPASPEKEQPR